MSLSVKNTDHTVKMPFTVTFKSLQIHQWVKEKSPASDMNAKGTGSLVPIFIQSMKQGDLGTTHSFPINLICVCFCMCMFLYVCVLVYVCFCMCMFLYVYVLCVYVLVCVCFCMCVLVCVCSCMCMFLCVYVLVCVCFCMCMFLYVFFTFVPWWHSDKEPTCQCRRCKRLRFNPWVGKTRSRKWQPTPVFLPGKSHGQRSLVGYTVPGVSKSRTWLSRQGHAHTIQRGWIKLVYKVFPYGGFCFVLCMKQKCASPASGKNRNNKKRANSPCSISLTMITKLMFIAYFLCFVFFKRCNCYYEVWKSESHSCSVMSDSLIHLGTVACQAPLSTEFSRQEYLSG